MTRIVIMAAGKGARMNSELPKVLVPLNGKPMIKHLMDSVVASGIDPKPIIIVSPDNKEIISAELKEYNIEYAIQIKPLGTGHAVACAKDFLSSDVENVLVLNGDHPFFQPVSLQKIVKLTPSPLALITTELSDFDDWRQNFYHWGRIIRDGQREIIKIIEFKDADSNEQTITEVNPNAMYFDKQWLFQHLANLDNNNKANEYYLTDLIKLAFNEGRKIISIKVDPREAMGINSLEELQIAEKLIADKNVLK